MPPTDHFLRLASAAVLLVTLAGALGLLSLIALLLPIGTVEAARRAMARPAWRAGFRLAEGAVRAGLAGMWALVATWVLYLGARWLGLAA